MYTDNPIKLQLGKMTFCLLMIFHEALHDSLGSVESKTAAEVYAECTFYIYNLRNFFAIFILTLEYTPCV